MPKWPIGRAANGNDGVAKLVKELGGSIGYVEFIYALQNHLSFGKVRNKRGEFVAASLESIAAAANSMERRAAISKSPSWTRRDRAPIPSRRSPGWSSRLTSRTMPNEAHIVEFLKWMLGPGQKQAAALGYLALPQAIVSREEAAIGRIH